MEEKKYFHTWDSLARVIDSHPTYWKKKDAERWTSVTGRVLLEIMSEIGKMCLHIYDGPVDIIIYKALGAIYMIEDEDEAYLSMVDNAGNDFHLLLELKEEET